MPVNPIKEDNLKLLREILRREKTATKSRLAKLSGLSVVTIQSLAQTLLRLGEIQEDCIIQPQLGRPAVSYRFNEMAKLALIIYMYEKEKKDTAVYLVCNLYGEGIKRIEETFTEITEDSYNETIRSLLADYENINIIAFGMPAEEINGEVVISDYKKLLNIDFASYINGKFGREVFLENDINAATFGYWERNHLVGNVCVAGIYMPSKYPPGAGLCQSGEIIKGRNGLAGEIKYLPLGIDWETFDYAKDKVEDFLIKATKILMCIYNPDKIVIYCEQVEPDIAVKLEKISNSQVEIIMLPDIEVKKELKEDFEIGMINLALKKIR